MKTMLRIVLAVCCFSGFNVWGQKAEISKAVVKKWETPARLKTPESVLYDGKDVIYVANINGQPAAKDGNGFISKISLDGRILKSEWITGLDAPKGMGLYSGKLYVTNITEVVEISIAGSKITKRYPAEGSVFLNDISISPSGAVYVSDSRKGTIYRLMNGKLEKWMEGLDGVNGLYCTGKDMLLAGTGNSIVQINTAGKQKSTLVSGTGSIDGLIYCGKNTYLFSDWEGSVYRVVMGKAKELLLNTSKAGINAADIDYIPSKRLLLVPTFRDNRVMAYELK
ncbi:MAG TPA: hypothetical protein PLJ84_01835 [Bacteroidales bacterium]|nr:hypothetical protein [Bacteroidales bacterium]HPT01308.1 hypothetical protein [Bacteroidales bacterium]